MVVFYKAYKVAENHGVYSGLRSSGRSGTDNWRRASI